MPSSSLIAVRIAQVQRVLVASPAYLARICTMRQIFFRNSCSLNNSYSIFALPTRYSLPSSAQASIAFPREVDHTSSRALGLRSTLLVMQERPITVSPYSMRHQASLTAPARTTYLARQVPSSISSASIAWTPGASLVSASRMANLIAWSQRQNGCLRPAVTYTGRTASLFKFERTWKLATLRLRR